MFDLAARRCAPRPSDEGPLPPAARDALHAQVPLWTVRPGERELERAFTFPDYWQTMAFVNAVAWVAHAEDHHPDLGVHYGRVVVRWSTHSVGGLSENDFICAAKVDRLVEGLGG